MKKYTKLDRKKLKEKYRFNDEEKSLSKGVSKKKYKREKFKPNYENLDY